MNRLRRILVPRAAGQDSSPTRVKDVFRRFFDLIERFERPFQARETRAAPEVKARITRLDDEPHRNA